MTRAYVELSGESLDLAAAEAVAAAEALGGGPVPTGIPALEGLFAIEVPNEAAVATLAERLALAHRCLVVRAEGDEVDDALRRAGRSGRSAAMRRVGRPTSGGTEPSVLRAGRLYKESGGRIALDAPDLRFWIGRTDGAEEVLLEEVAAVDRRAASARRHPRLPFQRPVSLPPRLARAAANLARVRRGDRVVDPFVGTGATLAEVGLLGGRMFGVDLDPEMVRGALRNLSHLGLEADALLVGDAGAVEFPGAKAPFDAVVTDPPYGRASSTGGEAADDLLSRVLPRWAARVRPGGRVVVIVPGPIEPPGPDWVSTLRVPVRVHRSLTREFRVFERAGATSTPATSS
jgi:tRNA (guanine10-N2)-dimethyltransferase